ncbi:hypothetical protein NP493_360g03014 [Ridgeia piscesae]|uniref:Uncharacterized protein n=1 Tax=Ridgeia piscesae TaxID=27915 RepID=A0AAD9NTZ7_RIDPI|nr:hypothetical protein NP493_360g03014 [Ridgeia piscesae]
MSRPTSPDCRQFFPSPRETRRIHSRASFWLLSPRCGAGDYRRINTLKHTTRPFSFNAQQRELANITHNRHSVTDCHRVNRRTRDALFVVLVRHGTSILQIAFYTIIKHTDKHCLAERCQIPGAATTIRHRGGSRLFTCAE